MNIVVEVPPHLPDAMQSSWLDFTREAKLAMAVKLYEMKRLSSGMAAALAGVGRVEFLLELHRFGAPVIDLTREELDADVANA
jgi:predicted HTH domain antitoxin